MSQVSDQLKGYVGVLLLIPLYVLVWSAWSSPTVSASVFNLTLLPEASLFWQIPVLALFLVFFGVIFHYTWAFGPKAAAFNILLALLSSGLVYVIGVVGIEYGLPQADQPFTLDHVTTNLEHFTAPYRISLFCHLLASACFLFCLSDGDSTEFFRRAPKRKHIRGKGVTTPRKVRAEIRKRLRHDWPGVQFGFLRVPFKMETGHFFFNGPPWYRNINASRHHDLHDS